mgnify:CR=1 FL=1
MLVHEYYCRSTLVENTFVLFHFLPDYLVEHRTHNIYDYQTLQKKEYTKDTGDGDFEERRTIKRKGKFLRNLLGSIKGFLKGCRIILSVYLGKTRILQSKPKISAKDKRSKGIIWVYL